MDGMYPDDLNKKSESPKPSPTPAPSFSPERPTEDAELYLPPSQRPKPKWRKVLKKVILIVFVLAIVVAIAAGIYAKFFHGKKAAPTKTPTNSSAANQTDDAFAADMTEYTSTNVGLTFSYPSTWKVADKTDKLTVTSPTTDLTDPDGQQFKGKIVFTVQPKGTTPDAFDSGGVISALDSQKIKYTKPTPVQRGQTYLTFLQYTQALVKGQLDGIYVTGDFGYQPNQYVPKTDIAKLDPLISMTFLKCDDNACASPADTNIQSDMWTSDTDFQKTISTTLKSIQVDQ